MTEDMQPSQQPSPEPAEAIETAAPPETTGAESVPAAAPEPAAAESAAKPPQEPAAPARKPRAPRKPKTEAAAGAAAAEAAATGETAGRAKAQAQAKPKSEGKAKPAAKGKPQAEKGKAAKGKAPPEEKLPPRLKVRYQQEILPALMRELGMSNPMQVPRVRQVVINMGVGVATQEPKALEGATKELAQISGQRPAITRARRSIAAFKVRQHNAVGCRVTLRGDRMYEFLDRLFNAALPRIRDFRGLPPRSFDGRGNYTMGLREQLIFPELNIDEIERVRGMDITITTTAKNDEAGRALLTKLGLPLRES
jgi:large subunit ribosomal protein L5